MVQILKWFGRGFEDTHAGNWVEGYAPKREFSVLGFFFSFLVLVCVGLLEALATRIASISR